MVQKFEQFERKLDELEAEADSYQSSKDLKAQFQDLEVSDRVNSELEALKSKAKQ